MLVWCKLSSSMHTHFLAFLFLSASMSLHLLTFSVSSMFYEYAQRSTPRVWEYLSADSIFTTADEPCVEETCRRLCCLLKLAVKTWCTGELVQTIGRFQSVCLQEGCATREHICFSLLLFFCRAYVNDTREA